jgi:hypothetical protein
MESTKSPEYSGNGKDKSKVIGESPQQRYQQRACLQVLPQWRKLQRQLRASETVVSTLERTQVEAGRFDTTGTCNELRSGRKI